MLKQELYNQCREYINSRTAILNAAINDLNNALHNETKSSAGDKYETSREMLNQEINLKQQQLYEIQKLSAILDRIDATANSTIVAPGSVVITGSGNYYIAIGAGRLSVNGITYYAISSTAPIAIKMAGSKAGDIFELNGKPIAIKEVL